MNISDIKAQMKTGFARPNLFRVTMGKIGASKQEKMIINCFQAQIPGTNILTTDRDIGLRQMSYQRAYADMMIGFYCSGDMLELAMFEEWMGLIVNPKNNHMGYYEDYTSSIVIEQLSREAETDTPNRDKFGFTQTIPPTNKVVGRWTLDEAFPKQVDPIQLDYGTNDIYMMVTVTITYRKFKADFKPNRGQIAHLSDFDKELGRKDYKYTDPVTGAYVQNNGNWRDNNPW